MGSCLSSSALIVNGVLTEDNYANWSVCMKNFLLGHDLWDIVERTTESELATDVDFKAWRKKDALALHAIQISCSPDIFSKIRDINSAKATWDHLAKMNGLQPREPIMRVLERTLVEDEYLPLYVAVYSGDWEATKYFLHRHPNALTASISVLGDTPLHIAVMAGHVKIAEELVKMMPSEDLVSIPDGAGNIPVVAASVMAKKEMVRYLYVVTPIEELSPEKGPKGATLLSNCIYAEIFDVALDLLYHYPKLAVTLDEVETAPVSVLARLPAAFPSGSKLVFWKRWVYSCIHASSNTHEDVERPGPSDRENMITQGSGINQLPQILVRILLKLLGIRYLYDIKLKHVHARKLLCLMCQEISALPVSQLLFKTFIYKAVLFGAIRHGIVEVILEVINSYPGIWFFGECGQSIFLYAIAQRQEKIFSHCLYSIGTIKNSMVLYYDIYGNNILHQAALLAPSHRLGNISGAALKMQRELQWFKEVENNAPPKYRVDKNNNGLTPRELFTEEHKSMVEAGEKWMKETATSCTVVAALISTIMFAAIFTVPGGYDEKTGTPLFLHHKSFMVFIISDALSLFSSSTSVLTFLGILTSCYREDDFLKSLPTKLIIGLSTLFFSIATMMITFGTTLAIVLQGRVSWISFPIVLLASIPVTLFALLQFPLLVEIFMSTYGPGIFDKPKKHWYQRSSLFLTAISLFFFLGTLDCNLSFNQECGKPKDI